MEKPSLSQLLDLHGKVAIVTGAGMGIGQAIAFRLAEAGAAVLVADIDPEAARQTVEQITQAGGKAAGIQADVGSVSDADRVAQTAVTTFGRIDILVNNAGIFPVSPVMEISEAQWDKVLDINLKGVFFYTQAAARRMIEAGHGGRIINIASVSAIFPAGNMAHYEASKGGVVMVTKSLAKELAKHKILVNAIAPGTVDTPGVQAFFPAGSTEPAARSVLDRKATPDEIARVAYFLVSGLADYMTGSLVFVDGGYLLL